MRPKERIKPLLEDLCKIWEKNPDLRLCQLTSILASTYSDWKNKDLFYLEDKDLEAGIAKYIKMHNIK